MDAAEVAPPAGSTARGPGQCAESLSPPPSLVQEHRTEIDARTGTFLAFEQFGQQLLARGHYASADIQQKLEALDRQRADLEKAWVQRRMMLDQCLELQVPLQSTRRAHSCAGGGAADLV